MHKVVEKLISDATFIQNFISFIFTIGIYVSKFESYFDNIGKKQP
jgi:hypothetical protein